jgi:PadR family transcriptional regulator, regulatory protein AphA
MRESTSRYAILGALTLEPMSGYQIKEVIGRTIGHFWNEGYGQIYPTLREMAAAGLVTSNVEPGVGKPDRHVFTLTPAGWDELRRWLQQPAASVKHGRSEVLLKLFLGRHVDSATNLDHVRRHRELVSALVSQYEAVELELSETSDPDRPYWLITLRHGLLVARAVVAWCDETIHTLEEVDRPP